MHVGSALKRARVARGLSLTQLSNLTKIPRTRLDAIEREAAGELPPLVYLRGYLREYARAVGLDPDEITDRYIAQFETTAVAGPHEPEAPPAAVEPPAVPAVAAVPPPRAPIVSPADERRISTDRQPPVKALPVAPAAWRSPSLPRAYVLALVLVALAAAAVGFMVAWSDDRDGVGADAEAVDDRVDAPADAAPADAARAEQEQAAGVDAARANAERADTDRTAPDRPAMDREERARGSNRRDADGRATGRDSAGRVDSRERAPAAPAPRASSPESAESRGTSRARDLTGAWTFTNQVDEASVDAFRGLRLGYRVILQHDGGRVTGRGRKISENGRTLPAPQRTPITLTGTIDGDRLRLSFREQGNRRASGGTFEFRIAEDGTLLGTFASDAARSRGQSVARKERE